MELKSKFLSFKKNFYTKKYLKSNALSKIYIDYVDYLTSKCNETIDKKVGKFKEKQYREYQKFYYDVGDEEAIFNTVYTYHYDKLKKEYRMKFRVYRESTRRKINKLNPETQQDQIKALNDSIRAKELALEAEVEKISNLWKVQYQAQREEGIKNNPPKEDIENFKRDIDQRISEYKDQISKKYQGRLEINKEKSNKKSKKYESKAQIAKQKLELVNAKYIDSLVSVDAKSSEESIANLQKEIAKYEKILASGRVETNKPTKKKIKTWIILGIVLLLIFVISIFAGFLIIFALCFAIAAVIYLLTSKSKKYYRNITEEETAKYEKIISTLKAELQDKIETKNEYEIKDDEVLSVNDLCMYFGGIKAVNHLSFSVKHKEIFGLIGPNGAGKTTVFNCITQFYKPTAGKLLFRNKNNEIVDLNREVVHNVILQGIVRTFQNLEVIKDITVLENLLVAAHRSYTSNLFQHMIHSEILRVEENVIRERAKQVLEFMGLLKYKDMYAWGLPYGILKKIEIARTLMCSPQLIILDEPAAGLNDSETVELAELIHRIRDEYDATILLVEHDMGLVMDVCDRICAISFGNLLALGTPSEIQSNKAVQEAYLGVSED